MTWKGFVEGGLASIVAGCATHPLDLIKVRMQLQGEGLAEQGLQPPPAQQQQQTIAQQQQESMKRLHKVGGRGPVAMGMRIVQHEGVRGLYAGVSATLLRQATYSTTRMGLYELMKTRWQDNKRLAFHKKVVAGLFAGAIGAAVGNPADMALVRMQANGRLPPITRRHYTGVMNAIWRVSSEEGMLALWQGSGPTIVRAMLVTAAQLSTYDHVKEEILHHHILHEGFTLHVVASCIAGIMASLTSNPVDVIKTRIMNMRVPPNGQPPYTSAIDCAIKTIRLEGPLALYKGLIPTMFRQGPYTIVLFVTLEQVRKLLKDT